MGCLKAVWWVQTAPLNCFVPSVRTQTTSAQPQVDPNWPANWADFRQPSRAAGFVVGLGKMHNHRFLATALPNRFLKPWPAAENLSGTSCRMHTCAKFWTRNAAVQSVRTPGQVLNPDFEKNMAKFGQSSGSPAGLMALRRCTTLCSAKSSDKRTDMCLHF